MCRYVWGVWGVNACATLTKWVRRCQDVICEWGTLKHKDIAVNTLVDANPTGEIVDFSVVPVNKHRVVG